MQTKYTHNGVDFVIIYNKEISEYYTQPYADMYNDLVAIKRDEYTHERIVVTAYGPTDNGIWQHFLKIVKAIDIPISFIQVKTNDVKIIDTVQTLCKQLIPYESVLDVQLDQTPLVDSKITQKFNHSPSMCLRPFINLEVKTNGDIGVCCAMENKSSLLPVQPNIKTTSIADAVDGEYFKKIRQDFLQGKKPSYCNSCWIKEEAGVTSARQYAATHYGHDVALTTPYVEQSNIMTLDIKLGFQCNLKCRICNYRTSSTWYAEDKKFQSVPSLHEIDYGFILDKKNFWDDQFDNLHNLKFITFAGGEPMLDKNHVQLLQKLIEINKTDVVLHYNTNGTQYNQQLLDVLDNFERVEISFSIDNVGEKFDYERNGSSWDVVVKNLEHYKKLDKNIYTFDFWPTVSVFNILDLDKLVSFAESLELVCSLGFCIDPKYFSIDNIPLHSRALVIDKLLQSKHRNVRGIVPMLEQQTYANLNNEFWEEIERIDIRRNQNFRHTYPDVAKIMS